MSTLKELRDCFRVQAHDEVAPYLWSDVEINGYLNGAVHEACDRARLIADEHTEEVCQIPVLPGINTYSLHPSILELERLTLDSRQQTRHACLTTVSRKWLDLEHGGWQSKRGPVEHYIDDITSIRLYPIPEHSDLLRLSVKRMPLKPMAEDGDSPEIPPAWHYALMDWALRCAFLKQDSEQYNPKLAAQYEGYFTSNIGKKRDANVQRKQRDKQPPVVRPGWF
jgi:hypothetical protein